MSLQMASRSLSFDEEIAAIDEFFKCLPEPGNLSSVKEQVDTFCAGHSKPIVLVTSGGTAVPIEQNTVRFVDNFSAGTRGSASTEYFLENGYAVVFLYRLKSLEPYARHINLQTLISSMSLSEDGKHLQVSAEVSDQLKPFVLKHHEVQKNLLMIKFTTLFEYLHYLRAIALVLNKIKSRAMLYLAAAVSDFYIPYNNMATHKIHSDEPLRLRLELVPKILRPLIKFWIPNAYVVSFKLETDEKILLEKARKALNRYGHKLVIANLLHSRKTMVLLVGEHNHECINIENSDVEIESIIVTKLISKHKAFVQSSLMHQK